ncbi:MAG: exodeoxyribonuclease VII small subunit [Bdellovibrionales bacterium]
MSDIKKLSFEDALGELEKIVKQLEDGKIKLEDAVTAYERGAALKAHCETKLREAQMKIDKIALNADGSVSTKPAEL